MRFCVALILLLASLLVCPAQTKEENRIILRQRALEIIDRLPRDVAKLDDANIRTFFRFKIAALLWSDNDQENRTKAESLAILALKDLDDNREEVDPLYENLFRRDLIGLLELHAPETAKRYKADEKTKAAAENPYDVAYSILTSKRDNSLAIQKVSEAVNAGETPAGSLIFFISELQKQQPALVPKLLDEILLAAETKRQTFSAETLFFLIDPYLYKNTDELLKRRFLVVVIGATRDSYSWTDSGALTHAFNLLRVSVPLIAKSLPALYPQAASQLATVTARLPRDTVEQSAIAERIRQSEDALAQTIIEANSATSVALKDDLLIQAAQLALSKGKLQLALDTAMSVSGESHTEDWRKQFLIELVNAALEKKNPELAIRVIAKIDRTLDRASALQKLAVYQVNVNDNWKSRESFAESLKLIRSSDNSPEKALSFMNSFKASFKIEGAISQDLAEDAVKAINAVSVPDQKKDNADRQTYTRKTLMPLMWTIVPAFEVLARADQFTTLSLVDKVERPELKLAALLGTYQRIVTTADERQTKK